MPFERRARGPMWIAGISICVLAASGIVTIVRSIPASYAGIPDEGAPSTRGAAPTLSENARVDVPQARLAIARDTINRRNRVRCPDCGVVESMRKIERSRDVGTQDSSNLRVARSVSKGVSGGAIAANAITEKNYEITVRFRDGSTTVFNEANARTWQLGSRVIVIGRSSASNN
jgi:hypothetical protein